LSSQTEVQTDETRDTSGPAAPFDKYQLYHESVQSPDDDMDFVDRVYAEAHGKGRTPQILREDFCAAFANCCAWVKRGDDRVAYGVDLDPEPLSYGRTHYLTRLTAAQQRRVHPLQDDVLNPRLPAADVICAQNFSYFIFKERKTLLSYFENALATLRDDGIFVLDCFGGSQCQESIEDETPYEGFTYYWAQENFDPITHHAVFHIHFQRDGEAKREKVFTYDWRMWTIPEVRDALLEAGFRKVNVYWEGTTADGKGDGEYSLTETTNEECLSWLAYLVALK
jgi:SAM-dependent methyltransferase